MAPQKRKRIYHAHAGLEPCRYCHKEFGAQGMTNHREYCDVRKAQKRKREIEKEIQEQQKRARLETDLKSAKTRHQKAKEYLASLARASSGTSAPPKDTAIEDDLSSDSYSRHIDDVPSSAFINLTPSAPVLAGPAALFSQLPFEDPATEGHHPAVLPSHTQSDPLPEPDEIRVRYPPETGRPEERFSFDTYRRDFDRPKFDPTTIKGTPWDPFESREDFELAELCLDAALNKAQIDTLLKLIGKVQDGKAVISLRSYDEMDTAWKTASIKHPPFERWTKEFPYQGETLTFEFLAREIWATAKGLIEDSALAPYWSYDAMILEKWNAEKKKWERIYDEPVTADGLWKAYKNVPKGCTPFAIYIYADKTRLSTFGTQQGYPIIMRLPQLDRSVRNGSGYGGGIVVGFLPVLKETAKDKGTAEWRELKGAVWHECLARIIWILCQIAKFGEPVRCGDGIERTFYLILLILSADYEEQCVMALTRSAAADYPCPVCLVHKDKLTCLSKRAPMRTHEDGQKILAQNHNKTQREEALKAKGLRNVKNAFWGIDHFNIHGALSFDRLHSYHSGLFGHHLFGEFKTILESMGSIWQDRVDKNFAKAPRWRDMNHFDAVADVSFTDASKYEDISKLIVPAACSVMVLKTCPDGYALLILIRAWIELDLLMSFEAHTDDSIAEIEAGLDKFEAALKNYMEEAQKALAPGGKLKNWNFPKVHMHVHAPDDIRNKGVTLVYNTKPNERAHRLLKRFYLLRSNFKNVEGTLANLVHYVFAMAAIRLRMDACDDYAAEKKAAEAAIHEDLSELEQPSVELKDIQIGAPRPPMSLETLQQAHHGDPAFLKFDSRLQAYLRREFGIISDIAPSELITEYRYLKVNFESMVTWKQQTDYLRCSPSFFKRPRYDFVIYHHSTAGAMRYAFAQLHFVFVIKAGDQDFPLALVTLMDFVSRHRRIDTDLSLFRVRARPRASSSFIPVRSIVRGAYLYPTPGHKSEHFVVDTVDADMFRRVNSIFSTT